MKRPAVGVALGGVVGGHGPDGAGIVRSYAREVLTFQSYEIGVMSQRDPTVSFTISCQMRI
jgi:hypothetical protein